MKKEFVESKRKLDIDFWLVAQNFKKIEDNGVIFFLH